jgi:hypothetical protein
MVSKRKETLSQITMKRATNRRGLDSFEKNPTGKEREGLNMADEQEIEESSSSNDAESDIHISSEEIRHAVALATAAISTKFGWAADGKTNTKKSARSNPLSDLIPGYIAPMSLESSSLDQFKSNQEDKINRYKEPPNAPKILISNKPTIMSKALKRSNKSIHVASDKTNAGSGWFNFQATPNSAALQADIAVIRNRNYLDPKKFYKSSDFSKKGSQLVQLGTVIEGSMESVYSNRLTKKQRKETVMDEVMADVFGSKKDYVKKKFGNIQREKSIAGQSFRKKRGNVRR